MDPMDPQPHQQEFLAPNPGVPLPPSTSTAEVEDLRQQFLDLRTLINAALSGLILLSLSANLVFGKQMLIVRRQIDEQRPNFTRAELEFTRNRDPEIRRFMDELHRYGASHPEFRNTILDRYRVALAQYFALGTPNPASAPIPQAPIPQPPKPAAGPPPGR